MLSCAQNSHRTTAPNVDDLGKYDFRRSTRLILNSLRLLPAAPRLQQQRWQGGWLAQALLVAQGPRLLAAASCPATARSERAQLAGGWCQPTLAEPQTATLPPMQPSQRAPPPHRQGGHCYSSTQSSTLAPRISARAVQLRMLPSNPVRRAWGGTIRTQIISKQTNCWWHS